MEQLGIYVCITVCVEKSALVIIMIVKKRAILEDLDGVNIILRFGINFGQENAEIFRQKDVADVLT